MKYSNKVVIFCLVAMLVIVSGQQANDGQAAAPKTLWDIVKDIMTITTDFISNYIVAPILEVVKVVSDVVIAPITNTLNTVGLNFAVSPFCNLVVKPLFPNLDADLLMAKCQTAALEEIRKGFDKTWVEPVAA